MYTSLPLRLRSNALGIISSLSLLGLVACGGGGSSGDSTASVAASSSPASSTPASVAPSSSSVASSDASGLTMLHADGAKWAKANGTHINLKGTNLGNWLVQEYWMMGQGGNGVTDQCTLEAKLTERFGYAEKERLMKLYHDSWLTERDWDEMQKLGFNVVRLPFLWSNVENELSPKTLRADAWHYFDWAIAQAKQRNMYVILDLHGVVGGQTTNDHTGCSGQNKYWATPEYHERTKWLWEQVATHYKNEPVVAAFDIFNEPWGSTPQDMATRATELYNVIRAVDDKHIVMLPSHFSNIEIYGNPAEKGMTNVAFELHPYPGLFGDRPGDTPYNIHRDWLKCGANGAGGVCDWNKKISALKTPFLIGEFQPWQSAGLDLGGKIARATYDTYASYGWAATSWSYKLVTAAGGHGNGNWGMVTNAINLNNDTGVGLVAKATTWNCAGWDSSFGTACDTKAKSIKVGGTGTKTYYFVIKTGALEGSNTDVTYDKISIVNDATQEELLVNGNFGSNTGWTELVIAGSESMDYNYAIAGKVPTGSEGGVLRISRPAGVTSLINGAIYQAISLQGGQTYTLSGVFKDNGSSTTWAEMFLVDTQPTPGQDVLDMTGRVDFSTASITDIENLYKSYATQPLEANPGLAQWLVSATAPDIFNLPTPPTNLKLVESSGSNALTWDISTDAKVSGYRVYRTPVLGAGFTVLKDRVTTNAYTDTTMLADTTYYYAVAALTATEEGYMSNEVHTAVSYVPLPGKLEAENYTAMSGVQSEACSDTGGGTDIGHFQPDDWIEFKVDVATAGNFTIDYRLATQPGSTGFAVSIDGVQVTTQAIVATGGWQTWTTVTSPVIALTAGKHTLRFTSVGQEWNINWFSVNAQ